MNYDEAMQYIGTVSCSGIMPGLVRIQALLDKTGHPERECNVIHVAGTNGKGSVCTYISAILEEAGYRVGRYVSPTLFDYRERIQINQKWISQEALTYWMSEVRQANDAIQADGMEGASAFEIETVLAFLYFKASHCDFVVLETGMGGRLDATNVVPKPVVSVITSIGMDHMHFLGNTIEAIAAEKGGIIKDNCPAVIGAGKKAAIQTLVDLCHARQSDYTIVAPEEVHVTATDLLEGQWFDFAQYRALHTQMSGSPQPWNAAIAVKAIEKICQMPEEAFVVPLSQKPGQAIDETVIRAGIAKACWPGRFEVIEKNPPLIIDGAHNPDGVMTLTDSIRCYLSKEPVILVMGVFADKDYHQMLERMADCSDTLITFKPDHPRGLSAEALAETASVFFKKVQAADSQEEALQIARKMGEGRSAIVCFGSLSTMAGWYRLTGRKSSNEEY